MTSIKQGAEEVNVFWGKDASLEGKMVSEGIFRLDGKVEGEINHRGTLIIGETAVVKGKVEATTLILNGTLEGEVTAGERMEIQANGKLFGNIFTPIFVIQDGGIFEGYCRMGARSNHRSDPGREGKATSEESRS
ncbi:MAG TPA: polymer-forming cytoskeletal protein [Thermodesulfobacteriota bacterium]|nr:polymer-forming cytoskeletal protein [Thermodesulfobacteriota bacterium]